VAFASAAGGLIGGLLATLPQILQIFGSDRADAYQHSFFAVTVLAAFAALVVLPIANPRVPVAKPPLFSFPRRSWPLLRRLWVTNSINGLAVGFFGPFITYWFFRRYGVSSGVIGILYAIINVATMVSNLGAAGVARRLGLVRAVVVTRIISALLLIAMALAPAFWIAGAIYLIRMMAQRVNLPLRQSYVMGMADPSERAAVGGLANLPAQGTSALSPILAGYIFENVSLALPFELGALFQALNGLAFLAFFRNALPPEERVESKG